MRTKEKAPLQRQRVRRGRVSAVGCISLWLLAAALLVSCGGGGHRQANGGAAGVGAPISEDARFALSKADLRAVIDQGITYLQWQFGFKTKQPVQLESVRVDDVTGPAPVLLVNDQAPQLNGGVWSATSGEIDPRSGANSWLYDSAESVRTFRFTITNLNGQTDVLEQVSRFSPGAKSALRQQYHIK